MPIPKLTGSAAEKYLGTQVSTSGVVTGVLSKDGSRPTYGVFLQDPKGDRNPRTSDAIFVRTDGPPSLAVGDAATAVGTLGHPEGGIREIVGTLQKTGTAKLPKPVRLRLPDDAAKSYELLKNHRGMLVEMPRGMVLVPSSEYGTFTVREMPSRPTAKSLAKDFDKAREGAKVQVSYEYRADRPAVTTGDVVEGIVGPLTFQFGEHRILQQGDAEVKAGPGAPKSIWGDIDGNGSIEPTDIAAIKARSGKLAAGPLDPADLDGNGRITAADAKQAAVRAARNTGAPTVRMATVNVENAFDTVDDPATRDTVMGQADYESKLGGVAKLLTTSLGRPAIVGLQEVENDQVLRDLVAQPSMKKAGYEYVWKEGIDPRSIDVALLYRPEAGIAIKDVRQVQGETLAPGKDPSEPAGAPKPLFMRPPLVVDMDVAQSGSKDPLQLTVVVNHLISKATPKGLPSDPMRIAQTEYLNELAQELRAKNPTRHVVMMGDLNDFDTSPAIKALLKPGADGIPPLVDVGMQVIPQGERYTYQFRGSSDAIDHVLVAPELLKRVQDARVHHLHADQPVGRGLPGRPTDHDIVTVDISTAAEN